MINSDPQQALKAQDVGGPASQFALLAAGLLISVFFAAMTLFENVAFPVGVFAVCAGFGLRGMLLHYPHRKLGLCNGVTLTRAAMVAVLAGAIIDPDPASWSVFAIACLAFAMDGIDGWLARRSGLSSGFGARFDMEIDALLGAVLALILLSGGNMGPEILVLGFTRYVFVAASVFVPKLRGALPESLRRKTVCVIQITTLIALLCPLTPVALMYPLAMGGAIMLLWSFAKDTHWLLGRS